MAGFGSRGGLRLIGVVRKGYPLPIEPVRPWVRPEEKEKPEPKKKEGDPA